MVYHLKGSKSMTIRTVTIEVSDDANDPQGDVLHEMLCRGIYEQTPSALDWLTTHVVDITVDE
jgi:hypothetical protein